MGIDLEMKAKYSEPLTDKEIAALDTAFRVQFGTDWTSSDGTVFPGIERDRFDPTVICLRVMSRYYSPGYQRGHWPSIRAWGNWIEEQLGEQDELRYGSDAGECDWELFTPWEYARFENDFAWEKREGNDG